MLRGMMGTKELRTSVIEIKNELPELREAIVRDVNKDMRNEFGKMVQAFETRMDNKLETLFEQIYEKMESTNSPANVVNKIEERKEDLERIKEIKRIRSKFSEVYANTVKHVMVKDGKYTEKGEETYQLFSKTMLRVAKLHGSNSINKVARREVYDRFSDLKNAPRIDKTVINPLTNGTVFSDLFRKNLVGKFIEFVEDEFLGDSEAI